MPKYYDRSGTPISDVMTWAQQLETADRQVADTMLGDVRVSTVFLGLDHQHVPGGPPLIFETMVFGGDLDDEMERYTTEAQAVAGHAYMVARVRAAQTGA